MCHTSSTREMTLGLAPTEISRISAKPRQTTREVTKSSPLTLDHAIATFLAD